MTSGGATADQSRRSIAPAVARARLGVGRRQPVHAPLGRRRLHHGSRRHPASDLAEVLCGAGADPAGGLCRLEVAWREARRLGGGGDRFGGAARRRQRRRERRRRRARTRRGRRPPDRRGERRRHRRDVGWCEPARLLGVTISRSRAPRDVERGVPYGVPPSWEDDAAVLDRIGRCLAEDRATAKLLEPAVDARAAPIALAHAALRAEAAQRCSRPRPRCIAFRAA